MVTRHALQAAKRFAQRHGQLRQGRANRWWGKIMGNSGQADGEVALLHAAASREGVRTVCEVGFNAGHAATAMLHGLETRLVEFDLLSLPYSQHARAAIEQRYPGRASFHEGRSQLTIPEYAAKVAADATAHPPCDLWMVDGDHWKGALLDMRAAVNSSRDGALIVADNCSSRHPLVIAAWRSVVSAGHVVELFKGGTRQGGNVGVKGWCVGRVVRKAGDAARRAAELRVRARRRATNRSSVSHAVDGQGEAGTRAIAACSNLCGISYSSRVRGLRPWCRVSRVRCYVCEYCRR